MKKILLFILSLSMLAILVSCGSKEAKAPEIAPEVAETIQRDEGTPLPEHKSNSKREGKSCSIVLSANPTTGFDWILSYEGDGLLNNYNNEQSTPPRGIAGAGLERRYFFKAERPGKCSVVFTYKRDWEGGETSTTFAYSFEIDDNLNIKYLTTEVRKGPGNATTPEFYNDVE